MKGIVFVLLLVLVAGCVSPPAGDGEPVPVTSPAEGPAGAPTLTYAPAPSFEVSLIKPLERRYEINAPCYWVAEVQAVNTGGTDARNVIIHCTFINTRTWEEKTQNELFPRFNQGERKVFEKRFLGECDGSYRMEFSVDYDRG